jgi:MOSC domain-containing protein YiiM
MEREPLSGEVIWIGVRPARRAPVRVLERVEALANRGLDGDRATVRPSRVRQITLIARETLDDAARRLGLAEIDPSEVRRNLVTRGVDLEAARHRHLLVGGVLLRVTGPCDPCARMEEALGEGGWEALRDRGGLTAVVLTGGLIRLGDAVRITDPIPVEAAP